MTATTSRALTGLFAIGGGQAVEYALTLKRYVIGLPSPQLSVSWHPWAGYYENAGTAKEKPTALMLKHLDQLARINELGPDTLGPIRYDVGWSTFQPNKTTLNKNSPYAIRIMRLNDLFGERALSGFPVVHQSPPWARPTGTDAKRLPDQPGQIMRFAEWFAALYKEYVRHIEFWNEPNLEAFAGAGQATPAYYMPVLKVFSDAARQGNPDVQIIAPNVSQVDWAWVAGCYALGLKECADAIGVHMYQGRQSVHPRSVNTSGIDTSKAGWERARIALGLRRLHEVMTKHGDAQKAIWNTEGGWSASASGVAGDPADFDARAALMIDDFLEMLADGTDDLGPHPVYGLVKLSVLYSAYDPSTKDAHQLGFAILDKSGYVKPQGLSLIGQRTKNAVTRALF